MKRSEFIHDAECLSKHMGQVIQGLTDEHMNEYMKNHPKEVSPSEYKKIHDKAEKIKALIEDYEFVFGEILEEIEEKDKSEDTK